MDIREETANRLSLQSDLSNSWNFKFAIMEWLTNAFHCEVDRIRLWDDFSYFHDLVNWDQLKTVPSLAIKQCDYSELLQAFLPVRLERKLTTTVYTLNCLQPIRFRLTRSLQFFHIHMNLTSLSLQVLGTYLFRALKLCSNGVEFEIPKFNARHIQIVKADFPDNINLLKENYEICPESKEIFKTSEPTFYCVKNNFCLLLLEETPEVYN